VQASRAIRSDTCWRLIRRCADGDRDHLRPVIPKASVCVAILADRGERYLDTIYSNQWVEENFGDVFHLWEDAAEVMHA
jgi:hypothetical protein